MWVRSGSFASFRARTSHLRSSPKSRHPLAPQYLMQWPITETGYRWTTITSSRAAISGRAARKPAAIPVFRYHQAADLAGGAIGSRWRSRFRFARVGHQGRSECRLRKTEGVHRAGRYLVYSAYPDRLLGL